MTTRKKKKQKLLRKNVLEKVSDDVLLNKCMPFLTLAEHVHFSRCCKHSLGILCNSPARAFWSHSCNTDVTVRLGPEITFSKLEKMSEVCQTKVLIMQNCYNLINLNLRDMCKMPLVSLEINVFSVNTSFLGGLSKSLKTLRMDATSMRDTDFENLDNLHLETLEVCNQENLSGSGLVRLANMYATLRHLDLSGSSGIETFRYLINLNLHTLVLNSCAIDNEFLFYVRNMMTLEKLSLANTDTDDACLHHLRNLQNLRVLNLHDCFFQGDEEFRNIKHVTDLDVSYNIGFESLVHISHMPLQNLNLAACANIVYVDLMPFSKTLKSIDISSCLSMDNLSYNTDMNLQSFVACDMEIKDWTKFPKVPTMSLCGSNINDIGLKELKDIVHLDLSCCDKITNEGLKHIDWTIRELCLLKCPKISYEGIQDFRNHRPGVTLEFEEFEELEDSDNE